MYIFQSDHQTCNYESRLVLTKFDSLAYVISQIAAVHEIADQIYVLLVLKGIFHIDKEGMPKLSKKLLLCDHRVERAPTHNPGLLHLFHGVVCPVFLELHLPDFAKSTPADAVFVLKLPDTNLLNWLDRVSNCLRRLLTLTIAHLIYNMMRTSN